MSTEEINSESESNVASSDLVTTMLDRPVADMVQFSGRLVQTWFNGLIDPWRFGKSIVHKPETLAQPFAFLVVMLFLLAVSWRLFWAIAGVSFIDDKDLDFLGDLSIAMEDVSLMHVVLATLPCVLVVHLGAWLAGKLLQWLSGNRKCELQSAACYVVGWQSGVIIAVFVLSIVLQLYGYEPTGAMNDEFNDFFPFVAMFVFTWGCLILLPSILSIFECTNAFKSFSLSVVSMLASILFITTSLVTLNVNSDIKTMGRLQAQRQADRWTGDLQINKIATRLLDVPNRFEVTLVFNNRSDRVLVVPFPDEITSDQEAGIRRGIHHAKVVSSSLDSLPARTMVLEPKQTRVATFQLQLTQLQASQQPNQMDHGFILPYHLRNPLEAVLQKKEAYFFLPCQHRLSELAEESKKKATLY